MLIDFTMKPTSETNFVGCLRELCGHSDVFRATFGQYLPYKVRPVYFILLCHRSSSVVGSSSHFDNVATECL
jgi:hypothetical protein